MRVSVPFSTRLGISVLAIFWFVLALMALLGLAVVGVFPAWILAAVAGAGVLAGTVLFGARWLFKRRDPDYRAGRSFGAFGLGGALAAIGLAGLPFFYTAYIVDAGPSIIPLATLSNGKKTVVFQGMQHVGSEGFYKSVVFDLEKALADGYVLFYEGVQPVEGKPELEQWFMKNVLKSEGDLSGNYQKLADSCGMKFQLTYFEPLLKDKEIHPSRHVTADVSYGDLKTEYERLMREDAAFAKVMTVETKDGGHGGKDGTTDLLLSLLDSATPEQKRLSGFLCRGVMATMMARTGDNDETEKLILDYRNRVLARFVAESAAPKIYVTYGAKHFRGFVTELKALDPGFEVRSLSWSRAMSNPSHQSPPPGDWPAAVTTH